MAITIALAGNPNCGKTTLFNALTGSNQYVGNWPGVTVEHKSGKLKGHKDVNIVDLPGVYSLSPYTLEEVVARNYLLDGDPKDGSHPDAILNIVDGTNLERNLYLSTQLMELGLPVVMAVNMMDIVRKNGDQIFLNELEKNLGCPVVEISALKGENVMKAAEKAIVAAQSKKAQVVHKFDDTVESVIDKIKERLQDVSEEKKRFVAIKLFERDEKIGSQLKNPVDVEDLVTAIEDEMDDDSESIITNERYTFIASIIDKCCVKKNKGQLTTSDKIDQIVTNRFLALPIFVFIMWGVYYLSIQTVGTMATDWTNDVLFGEIVPGWVDKVLEATNCAEWLGSLIQDGIVAGVGAVLGFVPQMLVLFFLLAVLESCGYMARIAFIMDRIFRKFGLSGKSFIPMLVGTGCGVPGIMASRTIENDRDRKMTIITTTFIPCGAKIPIIGLIAGALFNNSSWVATSAYFVGVAAIIVSGITLKKTQRFAGDPAPFVMELPAYHMPLLSNVLRSMWERGWSFIKKAGTVILVASVLVWATSKLGFENGKFGMVDDLENGLLANIGHSFAWIFAPLGWANWKAAVAAVLGLVAKEQVVGTLGVLYGAAQEIGDVSETGEEFWSAFQGEFTMLAGYSFLVFNLLCAPCFAAIGAIKREMNNAKWTLFAVGYQTSFAYAISLCIYQIGGLLTNTVAFSIWTVIAFAVAAFLIYMLVRPEKQQVKSKATSQNRVNA